MDAHTDSPTPSGSTVSQGKTPARLHGRWLTIARVSGVALVLVYLVLFVAAVPIFYEQVSSLSPSALPEEWTTPALRTEFLDGWTAEELLSALMALRLSPAFLAAFFIALDLIVVLGFGIVGAVIFWQRSDEWIGLFSSVFLVIFGLATSYSVSVFALAPYAWAPWVNLLTSMVWFGLTVFLIIFPDGRFVPRWMVIPAAVVVAMVPAFTLLAGFAWSAGLGLVLLLVLFGVIIYGQVYRYRRVSDASQRQQTKWMLFAVVLLFASMLVPLALLPALLPGLGQVGASGLLSELILEEAVLNLVLLFIPLAIGIAILRYRLWDIDVVINRALIYGALTAILAGVWAASVVLINQATEEMFGSESATTAAVVSTVLVASIFQPLRDRIKGWINKRFYPERFKLAKDFYEFAPHMQGLISTSDLLQVTVQRVTDLMHSKHGAILLDQGDGTFAVAEPYMLEPDAIEPISPTQKMRDRLEKARTISQPDGYPFLILAPLYLPRLGKNQVIGVLGLGPREKGRGYSGDDKKALAALGGDAGKAIFATQLDERKWRTLLEKAT